MRTLPPPPAPGPITRAFLADFRRHLRVEAAHPDNTPADLAAIVAMTAALDILDGRS